MPNFRSFLVLLGLLSLPVPALSRIVGIEPLPPIPPPLAAMDPGLVEATEALRWLSTQDDPDRSELVEIYSHLGGLYLRAGAVEPTEICFRNARTLAPDDPRWSHVLGVVVEERGDLDGAEALFRESLSRDPSSVPTLLRLGQLLAQSDKREEARGAFEKVLKIEPESAYAYYGLGALALTGEAWADAALHLEEALRLQPTASSLHRALALAYRGLGEEELAASHWEQGGEEGLEVPDPILASIVDRRKPGALARAIEARRQDEATSTVERLRQEVKDAPEAAEPHRKLGEVLAETGRTEEAVRELEAAVAADPSDPFAQVLLARLRIESEGASPEALESLRRAAELAPDNAGVLQIVARTLASLGRHEEALPYFDRCVELMPGDLRTQVQRARSLVQQGREGEAATALQAVLDVDPLHIRAHLDLGTVLLRLGDSRGAVEHFEQVLVLESNPTDQLLALLSLGAIYLREGDPVGAVPYYRRAVALAPEMRDAHFNLATALASAGGYEEAASHFRKALELDPSDGEARRALGRSLAASGRWREAVDSLEEGVREYPDRPGMRVALAGLLLEAEDDAVRDPARALEMAQSAFQESPNLTAGWTVARALAASGQKEAAVTWYRRVLANARQLKVSPENLERIRRELEEVEAGS